MDAETLRDFFNLNKNKKVEGSAENPSTSMILSIQGRTHPVDIFYVKGGSLYYWKMY